MRNLWWVSRSDTGSRRILSCRMYPILSHVCTHLMYAHTAKPCRSFIRYDIYTGNRVALHYQTTCVHTTSTCTKLYVNIHPTCVHTTSTRLFVYIHPTCEHTTSSSPPFSSDLDQVPVIGVGGIPYVHTVSHHAHSHQLASWHAGETRGRVLGSTFSAY